MNHHSATTWLRLVLASLLAAAMGIVFTASGSQAALDTAPPLPLGELTRMQIDGDPLAATESVPITPANAGVNLDWNSVSTTPGAGYGPQGAVQSPPSPLPTPPLGIGSTGLIPLTFSQVKALDVPEIAQVPNPANPAVNCPVGIDDSWTQGAKVDLISNIDNPGLGPDGVFRLTCADANPGKGDLFAAYSAYEIVTVPAQFGNPAAGGQDRTILYGAWERGDVSGELNFYIPISDGEPGNTSGDRLIAFDYDSSSPASFRVLKWDSATQGWIVDTAISTSSPQIFEAEVGFKDGSAFATGGGVPKPSFGEFALDLTAANVLPTGSGAACREFTTAGYIFTETGNSGNASLTDFVRAPAVPLNNCNDLQVTKAGPDSTSSPLFPYQVEQQDGQQISTPTTSLASNLPGTPVGTAGANEINGQFGIGETHTWSDVLAQPDYLAFEDPYDLGGTPPPALPTGWNMVEVRCTSVNTNAPGFPLYDTVVWTDDAGRINPNTFLNVFPSSLLPFIRQVNPAVPADFVPSCTITNEASGIIVEKVGAGDGTVEFPFTVGSESTSLTIGQDQFFALEAGSSVTITEGQPNPPALPGFVLTDITCLDAGGNEVGTPSGDAGVTVTVGDPDNVITCTFTNVQNGRIIVDKDGLPADSDQTFDFTVTGPAGSTSPINVPLNDLTIPGPASAPVTVTPGTYTVTELEPPTDADWVLVDIVCDNEQSQDLVAQTATVTVAAGETVNCTFFNNERGPVTVVKDAVLVDPAPVAGTIDEFDVRYTVTATSESNVTENITVTDAFDFPSSLTVVGGPTAAGPGQPSSWDGDAVTQLYVGSIAAGGELVWTIDVRVQLDLDAPTDERDCNAGGSGAWNDVTLAVAGGGVSIDDACVPFGDPIIDVVKSVVGDVTVNADATMSVTYQIDVSNTGTGPGSYELSDVFGFPSWVTVTDVDVTGPTGVALDGLFTGIAPNDAITDGPVGIGASPDPDTYLVTVTFTAAPTATDDGAACVTGPGDGLFNLASITSTSGPDTGEACVDIPRGRIVVTKATLGGTDAFTFDGVTLFTDVDDSVSNEITTTVANVAPDQTPSGNTLDAWVTPGSYGLTETAPAGWTKITEPCADFAVANGQTVTCDYVNGKQSSITVVKNADPNGSFPFALGGDATDTMTLVTIGGTATDTWDGLDAGTYTVTETTPDGFFIDNAVCGTETYENGAELQLGWGDSITCTYSNEAFGEIVIEKVIDSVDPAAATVPFPFDGPVDTTLDVFPLLGGESETSGAVLTAGQYTIAELVPAGWDLTDLSCSTTSLVQQPTSSQSTPDLANERVLVDLGAGDRVTCTFTNTQRGEIIVTKAVPADVAILDARNQAFDFSIDTLVPVNVASFSLDDDATTATLDSETTEVVPGTYTVTEAPATGWTLQGVVCDSVSVTPIDGAVPAVVEPGETVECIFTNMPDPADVTIEKTVTDVAADYPWSFEFTISSTDAPVAPTPASQLAEGTGPTGLDPVTVTWTGLVPGATYTIAEVPTDDWQDAVLDCGDADTDGVDDNSVTFVATVGLELSCTITNTPVAPTLVIEKTTVGGVGSFDFSVTPATVDGTSSVTVETVAADTPVQSASYELLAGESYSVDEIDVPDEWAEGALVCEGATTGTPATGTGAASFEVGPGDDVICRVTNSALGNITIIKSVVGANGTFTFDMSPAIEPITDADGTFTIDTSGQDPDQVEFLNLAPGTYVVSETDPTALFDNTNLVCSGPDGSFDVENLTATIELGNGDSVFCTFTNTERGFVKVDKTTDPAGATDEFPFSMTGQPDFILADGESFLSPPVPSGAEYTITEDLTADGVDPNWVLTSIVCSDGQEIDTANSATGGAVTVTPGPGEVVECDFTNELRGPVTVVKSDPTEVAYDEVDEVYSTTYTLTVTSASQIDEVFDLEELPGFPASGVDLQSLVVNGPGLTNVDALTAGSPLLDDYPIAELGELEYTVVATFTMAGDLEARECDGEPGSGAYNAARVTNDISDSTDSGCIDLPMPDIGVTKDVVVNPAQPVYQGGNEYTVAYDIVVTNSGEGPGSYTLVEDPDFGTGIDVTAISATSADGTVDPAFALGSLTLADGVDLQRDEAHTYRVTVTFTIAGDTTLEARDCEGPGSATYNSVSLTYNGVEGDPADDCVDLPDPEITITKVVSAGQPVHVGDNVYTAEYTITVDNVGDGPGAYDLVDTPDFGTGATVTNVTVTGNGVSIDQDGDAAVTIITGESIDPDEAAHVYTVTVTFQVAGSMTTTARTCATGEVRAGFGAYNGAELTYQGGSVEDDDCVDIPEPDVSIIKSLDAANPLTRNADGTWAIGYLLTVSNAADAGPAEYDLTDTFDFPNGVTVDDVTVQIVGADPASSVLVAGFDGDGQPVVASDVRIDDGETHVFRILVDLSIEVVPGIDGSCSSGGGLVNTMSVSVRGDTPLTDDACDSFSTLTLVKQVVNDGGGTATPADFTLTATGPATIAGAGTVSSAVPAGTYQLSETQVDGYELTSLTCNDASGQVSSAVVADGANVTCTFVNDDDPVADLAIVKTASVATTGPGNAFNWTLTVTNNGPGTAVDVVIADVVPSTLTVGNVTSSFFDCTRSGNSVTCTRPSMAVGASGTITIAVTVNGTAVDGAIVNVGTVESSTPDPDLTNNSDDASVDVVIPLPPPPEPPPVTLPATGSDGTGPLVRAALWLVLLGGAVVLITRRRRSDGTVTPT